MSLSVEAQQIAIYLVEALKNGVIRRHLTIEDVTSIGSRETEILPVEGVLISEEFECPSLSDFLELNAKGLIQVVEGRTSRNSRNWQILLKQDLSDYVDGLKRQNNSHIEVFLSYRRIPSAALTQFIARELKENNIQVFFDTRQIDGAGPFPTRLLEAIERSDIFACLVADTTFESEWVKQEIDYAHKLNKPMIPIFQESYKPLNHIENVAIRNLLQHDGVHILDIRNIYMDAAISTLVKMIHRTVESL